MSAAAFAAPGAVISNQASIEFLNSSGLNQSFTSNIVDVVTGVLPSNATLAFTRVVGAGNGSYQESTGPSACFQGGAFSPLADPVLVGGVVIDPTQTQNVSTTAAYNLGEPVFIRLVDSDQNADFTVVEYVEVNVSSTASGDTEVIRLTETGPDTGVFSAYVPTATGLAAAGDCVLQGISNTAIEVRYSDPVDPTDSALASAQLDPVGRVFESQTGTPVNGATIELLDSATGLPANVFGNDGISQFPSSITSGGSVTDSSGTIYQFGPGEYRFPVVPDGDYRLFVTPPPNYAAPSNAAEQDLQVLPGAPYSLGPGSFGNTFSKSNALSFDLDIPVDPQSTALYLQKSTLTNIAAPGDFVRYELNIENTSSSGIAPDVTIIDQLPQALRFVPGTVVRDGISIPDPIIDADTATLTFDVGDLAVSESIRIFYVVEIVAGKRNEEIINSATAFAGGGLISNRSDARIRLTEDLFRSASTLVGRVIEGDCGNATFSEDQGVANIRVYLEDGRYAVSDEGGRFHFEGLKPGSHIAQLDTESIPEYFDIVGCNSSMAFGGRVDSQMLRLSRGSLTRADFYLRRKKTPEGQIDIEMRHVESASADEVGYEVILNGEGNVRIDNLSLMLMFPDGVRFKPGTLKFGGKPVEDSGIVKIVGPSLTMQLPSQIKNWTQTISFAASINAETDGELSTRAFARFDTPIAAAKQTPMVETRMVRDPATFAKDGYILNLNFPVVSTELSEHDLLKLGVLLEDWRDARDIQIYATGHSDSQRISKKHQHLFADNYVLSAARARVAANFIANALNIPAENIQVTGRGPAEPIASNATAEGRQKNRRVGLVLSGVRPKKPSFLEVTQASSGTHFAETKGARPGSEEEARAAEERAKRANELTSFQPQVEPPIASLSPGPEMLLPERGYLPALPVTRISIKHGVDQSTEVSLNGEPVGALNFDGQVTDTAKTFAISRWAGVDLKDGKNVVVAVVHNANGTVAKTIKRSINYTGAPIRGEIVSDMSVLVADGKTRPVIAVRFFDRSGDKTRKGSAGSYSVSSPYRSWWEVEDSRKNKIVEVGNRQPLYRIAEDGIALIELAPTTHSGEAVLTLNFENNRQQEVRVWLSAEPRDWILVGFAEGTAGYNTISDNQTAAFNANFEDGYYDEGRVAFFAKGSVKGEYLLTVAYDSARDRDESREQFQTLIDPNAYYPLYADKSEQRFEAASQRKLFVKLEKRQFFALFGDFSTGLSYTELARYERRMNGFHSEYRGENLGYTAFASETDQSFIRDEIRGDGTSGLYRLTSAPIIGNSDQIRLEVRDRFDTGTVLSQSVLTRHLDYNIDTLTGALYFKKPVPSRDQNFNPIFIVAEYESYSDANEGVVAGGRVSAHFMENQLEVGTTRIEDSQQGSEANLTGADFRWQINPETQFRAEIASSDRDDLGTTVSGSAHAFNLEHQSKNIDLRAYIKEVEEGFGLGVQSAAETGVRKIGIDGRARFNENFHFDGEATWQQNLVTETIRGTVRGRLRYENKGFSALAGVVHASDKYDDKESLASDLAEVGVSQSIGDVRLRATGNFALSGTADNVDFPTSILVGADYKILRGVELFAEYEDASGRDIDAQMSRVGVRASPWHRAQLNTSITNQTAEYGPRLFANVGLVQGFQLNENWVLDIGMDSTKTLTDPNVRVFDPDRELVSGSFNEDFAAYFVGATYNAELWSANSRIEIRESDSEDRLALLAGWYREPSMGHSLSAGLALLSSTQITGDETRKAALKYGWAWRKADSRWSFLNRIDVIFEELLLTSQSQKNNRLINNFNANRRINERSQLSLQYAFKYVRATYDGSNVSGFTDLTGIDFRHGFNSRWDAGVQTSIYQSHRSKTADYGLGLDVGFNVRDNMWVTLGYNLSGFYDSDFSNARYTAQGPFLRLVIRADQYTLKKISGNR